MHAYDFALPFDPSSEYSCTSPQGRCPGGQALPQISPAVFQTFFIVDIGGRWRYLLQGLTVVSKEWEVLVGERAVIHGASLFVVK